MAMLLGVVPWAEVSKTWITLTAGGAHSCWSRIFLLIGLQLASQMKVYFSMRLWQGSSAPTDANILPMERRY